MNSISAADILNVLRPLLTNVSTVLIGIDGCGGSGKSTLARALVAASPSEVTMVQMDDFYKPSAERPSGLNKQIGGNFDWERVRDSVLIPLSKGEVARYQRYDWPSDSLAEWHEILPGKIVVVEGVYSTRNEIRDFYSFRTFVECPQEVRLERGLARDGESARDKWVKEWMPAEDRYIQSHQPWKAAQLRIDGGNSSDADEFRLFKEG